MSGQSGPVAWRTRWDRRRETMPVARGDLPPAGWHVRIWFVFAVLLTAAVLGSHLLRHWLPAPLAFITAVIGVGALGRASRPLVRRLTRYLSLTDVSEVRI